MKKIIIPMLCSMILLSSCEKDDLCLKGSGTTNVYELTLDTFDQVSLEGPVNLSISQSDIFTVEVIAEPEMFQALDYAVKDEHLEIGFMKNIRCFDTTKEVWVHVSVPDIKKLYVSGTSKIISEGSVNLSSLYMHIAGVGDVALSGTVQTQTINVSGTATVESPNFISQTTHIDVQGLAEIQVAVTEFLDIEVDGSASIDYKGDPKINKDVRGILNLSKID